MMKNKSYIWVSLVVLVFGILFIPKIIDRVKNHDVVRGERLDAVANNAKPEGKELITIAKAPKFELTDQDGKKSGSKFYKGKVYVLEFFFTTCPTICPKMNQNMLVIEKQFFGNPNFGIASITINPEHDTAKVLKDHAEALGVKSTNWRFFTGDRDYIFNLANKGFNLYAGTNPNIEAGFEHSGFFALVDKNGNIRSRLDEFGNPIAYYDGTEKEGVRTLMTDIAKLLKE
ncbi:SCO family protein [Flavobacterium silvaticum]|uniref:SCO family protein n=1 Tax=Flavobacterium silvaticum TaxID=1852020 RepID=A0A972FYD6_9FLAO|nr:SCO family protein [Flavobacterium silvaticum]NMH27111.1 SCO family protein [Flavobacterium silvaticum]